MGNFGQNFFYNTTAESFKHKETLLHTFINEKNQFCVQQLQWHFQPPFGGLRGNMRMIDFL